ncbi:TetR/AcrR family transcriptional regulator [Clostridium sp.]|uniref:TetR/AcrR family transcriptional regulator n=1 Tax=Clostridium sp. TaxID=1506 RepID=UPI002852C4EC|nr:TetR/AcrR family transcriptional regulator [Clostridium sp.]
MEKFESLQDEKKKRILDAAIEEFAINGYDKASTNSIVKRAGISKGILFHYFGSKKNLFLYLFDYCITNLADKYYLSKDNEPEDLFERFIRISIRKMKIVQEEPLMNELVYSAITNMPESLKNEITERYSSYSSKYLKEVFENLDTSKFRKEIDSQKAIEVVMICMDGLSSKYTQKYKGISMEEILKNVEEIMEDFNKYLEILKFGVYEESK